MTLEVNARPEGKVFPLHKEEASTCWGSGGPDNACRQSITNIFVDGLHIKGGLSEGKADA